MFKLFLFLAVFFATSCNNAPDVTEASGNADSTTATKSYTWDSEDEKEYLAQCVETAKGNVNDTTAYARCKCVLDQLKRVYPSMDSAYAHLDSAAAVKYAENCK